MIAYFFREKNQKELEVLSNFKIGSWVYAEKIEDKEIELLENQFGLDDGHLRDALDPFEVPRLEIENGAVYIFSRVPTKKDGLTNTAPILLVIDKKFFFTLSTERFDFMDRFFSGKIDTPTNQKIGLFCGLISEINAIYSRQINDINRKVRRIRAEIEHISNKEIIRFVDFEQILNDYISALVPMSANLKTVLKGNVFKLEEENIELVEDLLLHSEQLVENAKSTLKNIVNIREAYSTILSQDLNRVMKILTALTIIVTVPTMISSFYGMNISLPFAGSRFAFLGVFWVALVAVGFLVLLFRRNRWL